MYHLLSDIEIQILDSLVSASQIVITHVGDGEFTCNVFGNAFSNFSTALRYAKIKLPRKSLGIFYSGNINDIYIADASNKSYASYFLLSAYARLSITTINSDFNIGF